MGTASSRVWLLSQLRNLVSEAFSVGEAAAAFHIQEVSRVFFKVGQRQGVFLTEVALGLCLQEGTLIVREGHGEQSVWVADKFVDISLSSHLPKKAHLTGPG